MCKIITNNVRTLYYVWVNFSILLSEVVNSTLDRRSDLILVPWTLSGVVLGIPTYAAGIIETIVWSVPMILTTVLASPTASYYWSLRRSLNHWPKYLVLLSRCSGC